jgi:soluble lytic murein transglycosylase-like protein
MNRLFTLLVVIALALPTLIPPAASGEPLGEQIQAIKERQGRAESERAQIDLQIKLGSNKLVAAQKRVNELQASLNDTKAKRQATEAQLAKLEQELAQSRAKLARAEKRLAARQQVFAERMVSVYKNGRPSLLAVLLGSTSFSDLINRLSYVNRIAQADSRLLAEIESLAAKIADQLGRIEAAQTAEAQRRADLLAQEEQIQALTADIIAQQERLQAEVAKQQELYAQKQQELSQLASVESDLRAQAARASAVPPGELRELAVKYAEQYGIPTNIFLNLVTVESGWNPQAVSRAGAIGLTQVMPFNVIAYGYDLETFRNSPALQLEVGARYLSLQYQTFGRWDLALAAYNAGPGAVLKYGGIPPYPETQNYVRKILG